MKRQIYSGKPKAGELPFNYGTIFIITKENGTIEIPVKLNRKCSIFIGKANSHRREVNIALDKIKMFTIE